MSTGRSGGIFSVVARCRVCDTASRVVSAGVDVCASCLRTRSAAAVPLARERHRRSRESDGLTVEVPDSPDGVKCRFCANECRIAAGEQGFCGARGNVGGRLQGGVREANVSWYQDSLPTNCVGDWVCAGGTGSGYPTYARRDGPEYGFRNLAVFSQTCGFDCAYCQNACYRDYIHRPTLHSTGELADAVGDRTGCICFFGGDPGPQMPYFLSAAGLALVRRAEEGKAILRICWETNGSMHPRFLDRALDMSIASGGCVKFDLKASTPAIHEALTGSSKTRTFANFARAATRIGERPEPPPLIASTLMVPGYVEEEEVGRVAAFVAGLDPAIPYTLLAFSPQHLMADLPRVSGQTAQACREAALEAGLQRVRIGNTALLR